jgi:hypothetical protein
MSTLYFFIIEATRIAMKPTHSPMRNVSFSGPNGVDNHPKGVRSKTISIDTRGFAPNRQSVYLALF